MRQQQDVFGIGQLFTMRSLLEAWAFWLQDYGMPWTHWAQEELKRPTLSMQQMLLYSGWVGHPNRIVYQEKGIYSDWLWCFSGFSMFVWWPHRQPHWNELDSIARCHWISDLLVSQFGSDKSRGLILIYWLTSAALYTNNRYVNIQRFQEPE